MQESFQECKIYIVISEPCDAKFAYSSNYCAFQSMLIIKEKKEKNRIDVVKKQKIEKF